MLLPLHAFELPVQPRHGSEPRWRHAQRYRQDNRILAWAGANSSSFHRSQQVRPGPLRLTRCGLAVYAVAAPHVGSPIVSLYTLIVYPLRQERLARHEIANDPQSIAADGLAGSAAALDEVLLSFGPIVLTLLPHGPRGCLTGRTWLVWNGRKPPANRQ